MGYYAVGIGKTRQWSLKQSSREVRGARQDVRHGEGMQAILEMVQKDVF